MLESVHLLGQSWDQFELVSSVDCNKALIAHGANVTMFLSNTGCHKKGEMSVPSKTAILISGTTVLLDLGGMK